MMLQNNSSLCRDTEFNSYIAQVIKEDNIANVICSEHVKFPVYALQSVDGPICVCEIPVFVLNEHMRSQVYSMTETNCLNFKTGINAEDRVVFY